MKLGFIGTGEITKAVVSGIISSNIKFKKILMNQINETLEDHYHLDESSKEI